MRQIYGAVFACLAIVGVSACGEASPPPPEGNALVNISGSPVRTIGGGLADPAELGTTVLDGTQGVRVSCTVKRAGSSFRVAGHIESPEVSLDISSSDIAAGAAMTFSARGITVSGALNSVDQNNNPAAACTVTTSAPNTKYVAKPGSIYAHYDCPNTRTPSDLQTPKRVEGKFLFTGCEK